MKTRRDVSEWLRASGLRPRKGLGQNFLVDDAALGRIVDAAELSADDVVLEIGPGPGTLTRLLVEHARRVLAVEIDANMVGLLREVLGSAANLEIIQGDILALPGWEPASHLQLAAGETYKVVANLPYYITSAVLRHVLESDPTPSCMVVTVQEEVARRIVAKPGDMSLLAVSVQLYGIPRIVARIPAGAFYPVPKVDSAVLRVDLSEGHTVAVEDVTWFFTVVRAGFSARRKQLHNVLSHTLALSGDSVKGALRRCDIEPSRRAQTLSLSEWARLSRELATETSPFI